MPESPAGIPHVLRLERAGAGAGCRWERRGQAQCWRRP